MIFISHSHNDQGPYSTLCTVLKHEGLPYWDPASMGAGLSLKDQLREAISKCGVCIFLATRSSVQSPWCLTETGAFWGAGKRIILFSANPDIEKLPPLFDGDLWTCEVQNVIKQARDEVRKLATSSGGFERGQHVDASKHTSELDEVQKLILKAVAQSHIRTHAELGHILGLSLIQVEYHVEELRGQGFLKVTRSLPFPKIALTHQAKGYLIGQNMI